MSAWIVPPKANVIEPAIAPEFYITGCAAIEQVAGDCARFYLTAEQMPLETIGADAQQVVLVKIVRPLGGLACTIIQLAQCLTGEFRAGVPAAIPQGPFLPRLVR